MFNFERLDVWQKSIAYADLIYVVSRHFPVEERFSLTNQIRRAAISIASNIAEGSARPPADSARFIGYASGSLFETITQATIARNQAFMKSDEYQQIHTSAEEISRMLSGLRHSLGD